MNCPTSYEIQFTSCSGRLSRDAVFPVHIVEQDCFRPAAVLECLQDGVVGGVEGGQFKDAGPVDPQFASNRIIAGGLPATTATPFADRAARRRQFRPAGSAAARDLIPRPAADLGSRRRAGRTQPAAPAHRASRTRFFATAKSGTVVDDMENAPFGFLEVVLRTTFYTASYRILNCLARWPREGAGFASSSYLWAIP